MTAATGSFRIAAARGARFGRLVDRERPLAFSFDGERMRGLAGDTLASALMANGVRALGLSERRRTPQGLMAFDADAPDALVTLGAGTRRQASVKATELPLAEGLVATTESLRAGRAASVADLVGRIGGLLRGRGLAPPPQPGRGAPPAASLEEAIGDHVFLEVDVLVVGGGLAGIAAAESAASQGARVLLAEAGRRYGGIADLYDGRIDEAPLLEALAARLAALAASERVHLLADAPVVALDTSREALVLERRGGDPRDGGGSRLWQVRAAAAVLATGAVERPLAFPGCGTPGIVLATHARALARRQAVAAGRVVTVLTASDEGYRTAFDLAEAGCEIARIVDARWEPDGSVVDFAKALGFRLTFGSALLGVATLTGGQALAGATIGLRAAVEGFDGRRDVACDTIVMSGGFAPRLDLFAQVGAGIAFDAELGAHVPQTLPYGIFAAGAVRGRYDAQDVMDDGRAAGEAAASHALGPRATGRMPHRPEVSVTRDAAAEAIGFLPQDVDPAKLATALVDRQQGISVAHLAATVAAGVTEPLRLARATGLGGGAERGALAVPVAALALGALLKREPPLLAGVQGPAPAVPVPLGVLAGPRALDPAPRRRSPVGDVPAALPAEPSGPWIRAAAFPLPGETTEMAVRREARLAREAVALLDASPLTKLSVEGPGAHELLDRFVATNVSDLATGRCRYVIMLDERGHVADDGVVHRLGPSSFLLTSTAAHGAATYERLDFAARVLWPEFEAAVTDLTDSLALLTVIGPKALETLGALIPAQEMRRAVLPRLATRRVVIDGIEARLSRISFSGAPGFEIAVSAGYGIALWRLLLAAGAAHGIRPIGVETRRRLALENGVIAIGIDTDGTTAAGDLGLAHLVATGKPDFLGKQALALPDLQRTDRPQLIGLVASDPEAVIESGDHMVADPEAPPPRRLLGHVTSAGFSPRLGRTIALALTNGAPVASHDTVHLMPGGRAVTAQVVAPRFLDIPVEVPA